MIKYLSIIYLFFLSPLSFANSVAPFIDGLKEDLFFSKTARAYEVGVKIRVKGFGPLTFFNKTAGASYNSKLNTINLDQNLFEVVQGKNRIKDARILRGTNYIYGDVINVFHEMAHAEIDFFVETRKTVIDLDLFNHYEFSLKNFYRKNYPGLNPYTLFHEHFAYYRGDLVEFLYQAYDQILMNNGYNIHTGSCHKVTLNHLKKQLAENISLEEFSKIHSFSSKNTIPYQDLITSGQIYMRGKLVDFTKNPTAKKLLSDTNALFFQYHQEFYNFPHSQLDFVKRMNKNKNLFSTISACKKKFWTQFHR